jgi:amidase
MGDGFFHAMTVGIANDVARWGRRLGRDITGELEPMNLLFAQLGSSVTAQQYVAALDDSQAWSRRVAAWWEDHDVLVLPVSAEPPVRLGEIAPDNPDPTVGDHLARLVQFTQPFDVTGQPAISLPLHWNDAGLPIGVQLVAAYGREDVLLRLAAQLEEAQPWAHRRPPVHA